jgi:Uma2 family endonuclease
MYATRRIDPGAESAAQDDHVILRGMSWKDFEVLLAIRGDAAGVRMYYLDGEIELMSPSSIHEYRKTTLARLLEQWALETGIDLEGFGSWTLKDEPKEAGAEPDECYVVGSRGSREVPDLVIEVEWSRKGLAKREIYRRLGVRELWTFQRDGRLVVRVLEKGQYVERRTSRVLAKLDVPWLAGFLAREPQSAAVRALREEMRKRRRR